MTFIKAEPKKKDVAAVVKTLPSIQLGQQAEALKLSQYKAGIRLKRIMSKSYFGAWRILVSANATLYYPLNQFAGVGVAQEEYQQTSFPAGQCTKLRVKSTTNTMAGDVTFLLRKNGADTALSITIPAGVNSVFESKQVVDVAEGDLLDFEVESLVAGGAMYAIPLLEFQS